MTCGFTFWKFKQRTAWGNVPVASSKLGSSICLGFAYFHLLGLNSGGTEVAAICQSFAGHWKNGSSRGKIVG